MNTFNENKSKLSHAIRTGTVESFNFDELVFRCEPCSPKSQTMDELDLAEAITVDNLHVTLKFFSLV